MYVFVQSRDIYEDRYKYLSVVGILHRIKSRPSKMFKLVVALGLLALVSCASLDAEWTRYKTAYNKLYRSPKEDMMRRKIWEGHLAYIQQHNAAYENGEYSFYLGENSYADMTTQEFVKIMNGYRMRTGPGSHLVHVAGTVWVLLGFLHYRFPRRSAFQKNRPTGVSIRAESGGLLPETRSVVIQQIWGRKMISSSR
ncbi:hypothetical protein Btru_063757 [Bulinus truncatus]|nr:hypothetical protein Btru_063757 [Bulinus truncatus]